MLKSLTLLSKQSDESNGVNEKLISWNSVKLKFLGNLFFKLCFCKYTLKNFWNIYIHTTC